MEVSEAAPVNDGARLQKKWQKIIGDREVDYERYWLRGDAVIRRYEDRREELSKDYTGVRTESRRYNILWSNTETLQPLVFSRIPEPVVQRRNKDNDDDKTGVTAAEVLQRATTSNVERKDVCFVDHMELSVFNMLVPGTGQLWIRYEPTIDIAVGPDGFPMPQKTDEKVAMDYVHWRDFLCTKANAWSQVWWVARKLWVTEPEAVQMFGREMADQLQFTKREGEEDEPSKTDNKAAIYEIWDKREKLVVFVSLGAKVALKYEPDPLHLEAFFPCPKPLFAVKTSRDQIPIPLYYQYQDQAKELDDTTTRIYILTDACKVVGVYNQELGADFQKVFEGDRNKLIPVQNWNNFLQKGGAAGNIVWIPLGDVVAMLQTLFESRERIKRDLAEITGITDIVRGVSSPLDAEGTNQLKVQWGASRMRSYQREVQRFARDAIALSAEVMAEHFSPENLFGMAGIRLPTATQKAQVQMQMQAQAQQMEQAYAIEAMQAQATGQPPPPQPEPPEIPEELKEMMESPTQEDVIGLLRSDKLRGFILEIETDSTIEPDDFQEKTQRTEFVTALKELLEQFAPVVQMAPELIPMVKETILFALQPYRAGRSLMSTVENSLDALLERAKAQAKAPPQPDPVDKAIQGDLQKTQMQEAGDTQRQMMQDRTELQKKAMDIAADKEAAEVKVTGEIIKTIAGGSR